MAKQAIRYKPPTAIISQDENGEYYAWDNWGLAIPKEILRSALGNAPDDYSIEQYLRDRDEACDKANRGL